MAGQADLPECDRCPGWIKCEDCPECKLRECDCQHWGCGSSAAPTTEGEE